MEILKDETRKCNNCCECTECNRIYYGVGLAMDLCDECLQDLNIRIVEHLADKHL